MMPRKLDARLRMPFSDIVAVGKTCKVAADSAGVSLAP